MVRETALAASDLIYPMFVTTGRDRREEIGSMPGQYRWSVDLLIKEVMDVKPLGIPAVILFGIPDRKDDRGTSAFDPNGIVQRAIRCDQRPGAGYPGHHGRLHRRIHFAWPLRNRQRRTHLNDETLECLREMARTHAAAGADMVAPSDMMDGRVGAIREELDRHGFTEIPIMAYAAKYASCLYAPFREAADSSPTFGDRRSYQMDVANAREALREIDARYRRGGRHRNGQTGAAVSRHHRRGARTRRCPYCGVSGERRIQHDQSGRTSRLAG